MFTPLVPHPNPLLIPLLLSQLNRLLKELGLSVLQSPSLVTKKVAYLSTLPLLPAISPSGSLPALTLRSYLIPPALQPVILKHQITQVTIFYGIRSCLGRETFNLT